MDGERTRTYSEELPVLLSAATRVVAGGGAPALAELAQALDRYATARADPPPSFEPFAWPDWGRLCIVRSDMMAPANFRALVRDLRAAAVVPAGVPAILLRAGEGIDPVTAARLRELLGEVLEVRPEAAEEG